MVITCIEFERASIFERIEISKVRKLGRDGDGSFLFRLAIEDLNLMAMCFQ